MKKPAIPINEAERLNAVYNFGILDTFSEEEYDAITQIAAQICGTSISLITILDESRQWFKSKIGMDDTETPRDLSFCGHAIHQPNEVMTVHDARLDTRFFDNPYVTGNPHIVFYAGAPLVTEEGFALGTLCVIHPEPKVLSEEQKASLKALSIQVVKLLELRQSKMELEEINARLLEKNKKLESFALLAAHDIKSPLRNMGSIAQMIREDYHSVLDKDGINLLDNLEKSSIKLQSLIESLLQYSKSDQMLADKKCIISLPKLLTEIIAMFSHEPNCNITFETHVDSVFSNNLALHQILINLLSNALKYNDKDQTQVHIQISDAGKHIQFQLQDNSQGIAPELQQKVFEMFETVASFDKYGQRSVGLGLPTVKHLVEALGGTITLVSELGLGSTFTFTLLK